MPDLVAVLPGIVVVMPELVVVMPEPIGHRLASAAATPGACCFAALYG